MLVDMAYCQIVLRPHSLGSGRRVLHLLLEDRDVLTRDSLAQSDCGADYYAQ